MSVSGTWYSYDLECDLIRFQRCVACHMFQLQSISEQQKSYVVSRHINRHLSTISILQKIKLISTLPQDEYRIDAAI